MNSTTADRWLQEYRVRKRLVRFHSILTIISLLSLIASTGWALYAWYYAYIHYGPAAIWNWIRGPLLLAALLLPLLLLFLAQWNRLSTIRIRTHTRGLQIQRRSKRINIPWNAVQQLYMSATRYGVAHLTWSRRTGIRLITGQPRREIGLDADLADFESLIQTIITNIYPRIGRDVDSALKSGTPVEFGPLQLSDKELVVRGRPLAWKMVDSCTLHNGNLQINLQDNGKRKTIRIRSERIPNLDICYEILRNMSDNR